MNIVPVANIGHITEFLTNFTSPHTRRAYETDLRSYAGFCGELDPFALATMIQYRQHLSNSSSSATVVRKLASLRSFMSFLADRGVITLDHSKHLKVPKSRTEQHTQAFSDQEAAQVMASPETNDFYGSMHRLVLHLLFNLGLRRSELVELKLSSISVHRGTRFIMVNGKGGKQRIIPLTTIMAAELDRYTADYMKFSGEILEDSDFLVQTAPGRKLDQPMNPSTVFKIVARYAAACGIDRRVSPHSCRATMISQLLENAVPARDVAMLAGHSSISTTVDIYDRKRDALTNGAALKVNYAG